MGRLNRRSRRDGARRWTLLYLHFTALLMIYATDEALKDRFAAARSCVVEMFPSQRRPGRDTRRHRCECGELTGSGEGR